MKLSPQTLSLWAKTGNEQHWLSLAQHMLDSADTAGFLFDDWLSGDIKQTLTDELQLSVKELRTLIQFLAGVHDLGKATKSFQTQIAHDPIHRMLVEKVSQSGLSISSHSSSGLAVEHIQHSVASFGILQRWLMHEHGWNRGDAERAAMVVGSHHGLPPLSTQQRLLNNMFLVHDDQWKRCWNELLDHIATHVSATPILSKQPAPRLTLTSQMLITGVVVMSDWIASNTDLFPLQGPSATSGDSEPRSRAQVAVDRLDPPRQWVPSPFEGSTAETFYRQRFSWPEHFIPNALQNEALRIAQSVTEPTLLILEAPMGGGKTEAGLAAADIIAQRLQAGGVIFGTPTTASSDGLFERVLRWASRAQPNGAMTSMFLAHSKNTLNTNFMGLKYGSNTDTAVEQESLGSLVMQHDWFYGRHKGVLSHVVIGTVDQILRLALQTKHVMLRHLALAGKIVIVDEVHAYDAYMQTYLNRAVEWLAAYGASVVLLSATLPERIRQDLERSYRLGRGVRLAPETATRTPALIYPRITTVTKTETILHPVAQPNEQQAVSLAEIDDDLGSLREALNKVLTDGGCTVVICNTVTRAQAVYEHLERDFSGNIDLLHAGFTSRDRKQREEELLRRFGPASGRNGTRPKRFVLVATQIVEQSLDLDFDLMITDFCPVDLLLQRAGRLHRHARPESERPSWLRSPQLLIRGIDSPGSNSVAPRFTPASTRIYAEVILLASYSLLEPKLHRGEALQLPTEISRLVQHTYKATPDIPDLWQEHYDVALRGFDDAQRKQRDRASAYLLEPPGRKPRISDAMPSREINVADHLREIQAAAQVRDIAPTLEVLLVTKTKQGSFRLLADNSEDDIEFNGFQLPDDQLAREIALNSVRLPFYYSLPGPFETALEELEQRFFFDAWQQSRHLKGQLVLPLNESGEATLAGRRLRYSQTLGLQLLPQPDRSQS